MARGAALVLAAVAAVGASAEPAAERADPLYSPVPGAAAATTVNWVSSPAKHGETVLVNGGGFSEASTVTLTAADGTKTTAEALDVLPTGLKFKLPAASSAAAAVASDYAAYDVSVSGSDSLPLNTPDIWWWQGDGGNFSTPGGWLRVFGRNIAATSSTPTPEQAAKSALDAALASGDLAAAAAHLSTLSAER
eukprot:SAG22_NODE_6068_length_906_cov_1.055762_1_plen_192_part_10